MKPYPLSTPSNLGYLVIDVFPNTEDNDTLITECMAEEKTDLADYIWVFENNGLTYQNECCTLCHHVTDYVKWQLCAQCKDITSTYDSSYMLLLSDECKQEPEKPENTLFPVYTVADYTHCNQTGSWSSYDADIDWACALYHSVYFAELCPVTEIKTYKNMYCYRCNVDEIKAANHMCVISPNFGQVIKLNRSRKKSLACITR